MENRPLHQKGGAGLYALVCSVFCHGFVAVTLVVIFHATPLVQQPLSQVLVAGRLLEIAVVSPSTLNQVRETRKSHSENSNPHPLKTQTQNQTQTQNEGAVVSASPSPPSTVTAGISKPPVDVEAARASNPAPLYPRLSRLRGEQGRVVLKAFVTVNGEVGGVTVYESSGYELLDEAALKAARQWHFPPAPSAVEPEPRPVLLPFRFSLTALHETKGL